MATPAQQSLQILTAASPEAASQVPGQADSLSKEALHFDSAFGSDSMTAWPAQNAGGHEPSEPASALESTLTLAI